MDSKTPIIKIGTNILLYDIPDACIASISLSEDNLPIDINPPTSDANGSANAIIAGREYSTIRPTCIKETFFERISSAINKS